MVTRLEHDISEVQLVVLLEVDWTGPKRSTSHTPEPNIIPPTGHHPAEIKQIHNTPHKIDDH